MSESRPLSLATVNWLQFGADGELAREPVPGWPLEEVLDGAAAAGFAHVGLDLATVRAYLAAGARLDDLGSALRSRQLTCSDVGVLALGAPGLRATAEALAELASVAGARTCIAAFTAPPERRQAVAALNDCADVLAAAGVRLALELPAYFGPAPLTEPAAVCEAVGWERCGLLVDTWHFFRSGARWSDLRSLDGGKVAHVHVNDGPPEPAADPVVEGRFGRRPVGRGGFPLAEFAAALDAIDYRGPLAVEVLSDDVRRLGPAAGARLLFESMRDNWPGS